MMPRGPRSANRILGVHITLYGRADPKQLQSSLPVSRREAKVKMKSRIALGIALLAAILFAAPFTKADGVFTASLAGSNEVPPNASTATGFITVTIAGNLLTVAESFTGLASPATGAHIHCCGAVGVNEPIALPFTSFPAATAGTYNNTFDLTLTSVYTSGFLTSSGGTAALAESALLAGISGGNAYANIHDTIFPGGEIGGQLAPVPESGTLLLLGIGLAALAFYRKPRTA
jgi:CHRD domain